MDTLEELTNDQIRSKLVEHGLANIPVTNTTRKVQLKRLLAAIQGGAVPVVAAEKTSAKNRRETIHVAKVSEKVEPEAKTKGAASDNAKAKTGSSRRATINVSAIPVKTNTPAPLETTTSSGKVSSRRTSLRASQSGEAPPEPVASKSSSKIPTIVDVPEEFEEDALFIPISQKRTSRQSRSPSLSKSETVVTAFKQVLARATPIPEETVTISDEEDDTDEFETSAEPELAQYSDFGKHTVDSHKASYNRSSVGGAGTSYSSYKPFVAEDYTSSGAQRRFTTTTSTWNQSPPVDQRYRTPEKTTSSGQVGVLDVDTPYLSDFTRRLSKLRAEPLEEESRLLRRESAVGLDDDDDQYYRTSSQVHGRHQLRKPAAGRNSAWTYVKSVIRSVEQKYRSVIWPIVFLLLVIFVVTVFLT